MAEVEKNVDVEKECNCEALKAELKSVKEELEKANNTIKQYDIAYKELQIKFNRLYEMLGHQIEYSLGVK